MKDYAFKLWYIGSFDNEPATALLGYLYRTKWVSQ